MVTPVKPVQFEDDGKVETLQPRTDRIAVDHPFVARNSELFEPAWTKDHDVRVRMVQYLRTASRGPTRRPARRQPTTGNLYGLGPQRAPWDLNVSTRRTERAWL